VWQAYVIAYHNRYGVDPIRNAKVSGQLANLIKRIPQAEAPDVAAHFVGSNNAYYVSRGHDVGTLLADAEKLRTEWVTGRQQTQRQAQQLDRTQSNYNAVGDAMATLGNRH
jgi:hypothetical protein